LRQATPSSDIEQNQQQATVRFRWQAHGIEREIVGG
jgi:hypothetical protein